MLTLVHPFATSLPSSPKGDARTLRDLLSVSYGMISILVISRCAAPPYPATPDFPPKGETTHYDLCVAGTPSNHVRCASTGKRVTRFSSRFAPLRIVFPCHPCSGGGQNKTPRDNLLINGSTVSTSYSDPACGGRWWRQPPKGECISSSGARLACFPTPAGRLSRFYHRRAPSII